jgi:hypothetical protein
MKHRNAIRTKVRTMGARTYLHKHSRFGNLPLNARGPVIEEERGILPDEQAGEQAEVFESEEFAEFIKHEHGEEDTGDVIDEQVGEQAAEDEESDDAAEEYTAPDVDDTDDVDTDAVDEEDREYAGGDDYHVVPKHDGTDAGVDDVDDEDLALTTE